MVILGGKAYVTHRKRSHGPRGAALVGVHRELRQDGWPRRRLATFDQVRVQWFLSLRSTSAISTAGLTYLAQQAAGAINARLRFSVALGRRSLLLTGGLAGATSIQTRSHRSVQQTRQKRAEVVTRFVDGTLHRGWSTSWSFNPTDQRTRKK